MNDILLDMNTFDIAIENGDLVVGRSDEQHQELLLVATKGDFKQHPDVGVDIASFLNDDNVQEMLNEVRRQFTNDGMTVVSVNYDEITKNLEFDASY